MIELEFTESGGINYFNTETGEGFCIVPKTKNADGTYSDTDLSQYDFLSEENVTKIQSHWTDEIKTKWENACKENDKHLWIEERKNNYPSVGDQLDMIMKDMRDGTTTHKEACEAVKAKYPKPE